MLNVYVFSLQFGHLSNLKFSLHNFEIPKLCANIEVVKTISRLYKSVYSVSRLHMHACMHVHLSCVKLEVHCMQIYSWEGRSAFVGGWLLLSRKNRISLIRGLRSSEDCHSQLDKTKYR